MPNCTISTDVTASAGAQGQIEPLPSWNDRPAKRAIIAFIAKVTKEDGPDFVPPAERIAVFDHDGTLWCEYPMFTQLTFAADKIKAMAAQHPEWKEQEPFKVVLADDRQAMAEFTPQHIVKIVTITHCGMTIEAFQKEVREWLASATDSRFKRPYTELVFQPMLEVMQYLRANGFKTYIVSGGGQEFVRTFAEKVYGVGPEQIIGSAGKLKYQYDKNGKPALVKLPDVLLHDDRAGKPETINMIVGRRPLAAFGNSYGDLQMLEWTQAGTGARLTMLVNHDDTQREYVYGAGTKLAASAEAAMAEALARDWTVISMKNDWKHIFLFEK